MITKIAEEISLEDMKELFFDKKSGKYIVLEVLRKYATSKFLTACYRENNISDPLPDAKDKKGAKKRAKEKSFLKQLEESVIFEKTEIEKVFANGFEYASAMGGGSYPCDLKIQVSDDMRYAIDIKSISYHKKTTETRSGESSLSQNFEGDLDAEFYFSPEEMQSIFSGGYDREHVRIKKLNELLKNKMNGIFTKYKRIRNDDHGVNKVLYLFIVKTGFSFMLIGLELFPELECLTIEELNNIDFLSECGNTNFIDKSLIAELENSQNSQKPKKIVTFHYEKSLFSSSLFSSDVRLYKAKKRIEFRAYNLSDDIISLRINPFIKDETSQLYEDTKQYFEQKFKNRLSQSLQEENEEMNKYLDKHKDIYLIEGV